MTIRQIFTTHGLRWAVLDHGQNVADFLNLHDAQSWANFLKD
jgi:hypothetical protein